VYLFIKWIHILLAITAVGANITYGFWIARASRQPEMLPFTLRGVKFLDDRVANPAYGLLLLTGLINVFVGEWSLTTPWIVVALVLYVLAVLIGLFGYTPALRNQIKLAETAGPASPEYKQIANRSTILGVVTAVLVAAIIFLMVVKPNFGL
jgi:uncharacterized membrane protein